MSGCWLREKLPAWPSRMKGSCRVDLIISLNGDAVKDLGALREAPTKLKSGGVSGPTDRSIDLCCLQPQLRLVSVPPSASSAQQYR